MGIGRNVLSLSLAVSLVACGGGDSSGPTFGGGTPTPTPTTAGCSLSERQDFAFAVLDEWYLFPELLDRTVNKNAHSSVQSYLDALVAPARAQNKDKGFTFITSIQEENDLINNGSSAGFGIRLGYDTVNNRVFILEAFENAPAFPQGFDRGVEIIQLGNSPSTLQSIATIMATEGPQGVVNRLGPSDPGVQRTFVIRQLDTTETQVTVSKAEYPLDAVSNRYGAQIINDGGKLVGYINLRTFIVQSADADLRAAFQNFRNQGVTEVILDFRYNGGGLVSIAELMGDLMGRNTVGQVFSRTILRPSKASQNSTELFEAAAQSIQPTKIAVIGRGGTASASELVTNSMIPYLGSNIALVGANTSGKPVGQFGFDLAACDDRIRAVTFQTTNRDNNGEYFDGLASVMPNTCQAADDISAQMGDPAEASTAKALEFLRTGSAACTPITGKPGGGVAQQAAEREILQPDTPSAVQREIPGLY
ncbi:S41 family peptidase [Pontixanthobacter aquaemixtae]|uniref:Peptidase S41 n=1 Tax=Pontixanthobacter aquaemixtae TaxID=1958940 RepID=A0A844ZUB9_9SPHN|nr:S41 family peptidase [Pontixanthobacter aquaemixtae]MXO91911.1 peptidase S41 [Pontixanthobacter aquaemixtae]